MVSRASPILTLNGADEVVGVGEASLGLEWSTTTRGGRQFSIRGSYDGQLWAEGGALDARLSRLRGLWRERRIDTLIACPGPQWIRIMKAVIQRVTSASVTIEQQVISRIDRGLVVLLGVGQGDDEKAARYLADKTLGLRIFDDEAGKMNLSVVDVHGSILVVSQFTLLGDCHKGRRPSFVDAAPPELAKRLYELFVIELQRTVPVSTGRFQADMQVALVNDGPVTILLET